MKKQIQGTLLSALLSCIGLLTIFSCEEEITYNGEPITNHFRVLQVTYAGNAISGTISNFDPDGQIQIVFSHGVDQANFESALSISPAVDLDLSYDESRSLLIVGFTNPLSYDTDYTLSLPRGTYGTDGQVLMDDYQLLFSTKAFVPPSVTLSAEATDYYEGDDFLITATLSESVLVDISFDIVLGGTAQIDTDYTIDNTNFVIQAGDTSFTTLVSILVDGSTESSETLTVSIENLINASDPSSQTLTINVNDVPPALELKV